MSAAMLASLPTTSTATSCNIPDALQQFLNMIEEQLNLSLDGSQDLSTLKSDLENKWRMANSEGRSSSTLLYEILTYGWGRVAENNRLGDTKTQDESLTLSRTDSPATGSAA